MCRRCAAPHSCARSTPRCPTGRLSSTRAPRAPRPRGARRSSRASRTSPRASGARACVELVVSCGFGVLCFGSRRIARAPPVIEPPLFAPLPLEIPAGWDAATGEPKFSAMPALTPASARRDGAYYYPAAMAAAAHAHKYVPSTSSAAAARDGTVVACEGWMRGGATQRGRSRPPLILRQRLAPRLRARPAREGSIDTVAR